MFDPFSEIAQRRLFESAEVRDKNLQFKPQPAEERKVHAAERTRSAKAGRDFLPRITFTNEDYRDLGLAGLALLGGGYLARKFWSRLRALEHNTGHTPAIDASGIERGSVAGRTYFLYHHGEHVHRWPAIDGVAMGRSRVYVNLPLEGPNGQQIFNARENSTVILDTSNRAETRAYQNARIYSMGTGLVRGYDDTVIIQRSDGNAEVYNRSQLISRGNGSVDARHDTVVKKFGDGEVHLFDRAKLHAHRGGGTVFAAGDSTITASESSGYVILKDRARLLSHKGSGDLFLWADSSGKTETSGHVRVAQRARVEHYGDGPLWLGGQAQAEIHGHGNVTAAGERGSTVYHRGNGRLTVGHQTVAFAYNPMSIECCVAARVHYFGKSNIPITVSDSAKLYASDAGTIRAEGSSPSAAATIELGERYKGTAYVGDHTKTEAYGSGLIYAKGSAELELKRHFTGHVIVKEGSAGLRITAGGDGVIEINGKGTVVLDREFTGTVRAKGEVIIKSAAAAGRIIAEGNCQIEHTGVEEKAGRRCKIEANGCRLRIHGDADVEVRGKGGVVEQASGRAKITISDRAEVLDAHGNVQIERKGNAIVRRARGNVLVIGDFDSAGLHLYDAAQLVVRGQNGWEIARAGPDSDGSVIFLQEVRPDRATRGLFQPVADKKNADEIRKKAQQAGNPIADGKKQTQFLDDMFKKISGWNQDLTARWQMTHDLRDCIQRSYEQAMAIALTEARKLVAAGGDVEAKAAELMLKPNDALGKNSEFRAAHAEWMMKSEHYLQQMKEVSNELSARQKEMQAEVDKFCEKHGLPKAVLDFKAIVDVPGGAYQRGRGVIRLSYEDLLSPRSAAVLLNSLTHEIGHLFHDKLIIQDIIDGLVDKPKAAGVQLNEEQIKKIQLEYRKRTGAMLDPSPHFLQEVNRVRAGKDLSATQKEMAKTYAESFSKSKSLGADFQRSAEHYRATLSEMLGLKPSGATTDLIRRLSLAGSESLCEHLFGVKKLELLPDSHPAKKPMLELVEKYKKASLNGKLIPSLESDIWSDKKAMEAVRPHLRDRLKEINEWRKRKAAEYTSTTHEQESSVLGTDVQEKAEARLKDLKLKTAERQAVPTKEELELFEKVEKEWRRKWGEKPLPAEHSRDFNDCLAAVIDNLDEAGRNREAEALRRMSKDYQADETRTGGERKTIERFNYLAEYTGKKTTASDSRYVERVLALGYDPIPVSADNLLRLGKEARIEVSRLGIKTVREKYRTELFKETDLTKERLLAIFRDQIKQVEEEYKRTLDQNTKAYLDSIKATEKEIKGANGMPNKLKSVLKGAAKGGSEVGGTAIGVGLIITAALGWYIRYVKESEASKEGLPPLPDFG